MKTENKKLAFAVGCVVRLRCGEMLPITEYRAGSSWAWASVVDNSDLSWNDFGIYSTDHSQGPYDVVEIVTDAVETETPVAQAEPIVRTAQDVAERLEKRLAAALQRISELEETNNNLGQRIRGVMATIRAKFSTVHILPEWGGLTEPERVARICDIHLQAFDAGTAAANAAVEKAGRYAQQLDAIRETVHANLHPLGLSVELSRETTADYVAQVVERTVKDWGNDKGAKHQTEQRLSKAHRDIADAMALLEPGNHRSGSIVEAARVVAQENQTLREVNEQQARAIDWQTRWLAETDCQLGLPADVEQKQRIGAIVKLQGELTRANQKWENARAEIDTLKQHNSQWAAVAQFRVDVFNELGLDLIAPNSAALGVIRSWLNFRLRVFNALEILPKERDKTALDKIRELVAIAKQPDETADVSDLYVVFCAAAGYDTANFARDSVRAVNIRRGINAVLAAARGKPEPVVFTNHSKAELVAQHYRELVDVCLMLAQERGRMIERQAELIASQQTTIEHQRNAAQSVQASLAADAERKAQL